MRWPTAWQRGGRIGTGRVFQRPETLHHCRGGRNLATPAEWESQTRLSQDWLHFYSHYVAILRRLTSGRTPGVLHAFCGGGGSSEGDKRAASRRLRPRRRMGVAHEKVRREAKEAVASVLRGKASCAKRYAGGKAPGCRDASGAGKGKTGRASGGQDNSQHFNICDWGWVRVGGYAGGKQGRRRRSAKH